jgi:hypothetical protein
VRRNDEIAAQSRSERDRWIFYATINLDDFAKIVIPAQAGIQNPPTHRKDWVPVFTGRTEKSICRLFTSSSTMGL